jgi:hypothetical protein
VPSYLHRHKLLNSSAIFFLSYINKIITFISSMKEGKPPIDIKVMKPVINPPQATLAKIAV